jgi:hypothetical protein
MEQSSLPFFRQRLMGRTIIVVLPIIIIIAVVIATISSLPKNYYFTVRAGDLYLVRGAMSNWVLSNQTGAFEPFSVKGIDLKGITGVSFKTQEEALRSLRGIFEKRVQEQCAAVLNKEKELVGPYTDLLRDMQGAKAGGVPGLEKNIVVLKGWLDMVHAKTTPQAPAPKS